MMIGPLQSSLRRAFPLLLLTLYTLLSACSNGNDNFNIQDSTLGVPGAGNPNTVAVPGAAIEGPIAGNPTLVSTFFPLAPLGYEQAEYFVSGTANAYTNVNELNSDGNWQVEASEQADYKTRIVVIRPSDPADFNGTVFVEWLNVSAGADSPPDWIVAHNEFIREGYAYVGVSAQAVGVNALKNGAATAARYASLLHPGDSYSYSIFSRAGLLAKETASTLLGGLTAERVLAAGESQSAFRLVTYIDAVQPLEHVYDGFLVHSRFGTGAAISQSPLPAVPFPAPAPIRDDLDVPGSGPIGRSVRDCGGSGTESGLGSA